MATTTTTQIEAPEQAVELKPDIVLGAMYFGTTVPEDAAFAILDAFVEAGGVWIDTADCYAFWTDPRGIGGASEELIGKWLRNRPEAAGRVRISTKVGNQPTVPHRWPESAAGLSARAIRTCVEQSLHRLGRDHVDLLWAHTDDRSVPLEETVRAFSHVHRAGQALRLGCSNNVIWRLDRARRIATDEGVEPYTAIQLRRSYVEPRPSADLPDQGHLLTSPEALDYAASEELPLWYYTPLLNGAYVRDDKPFPEAYDHPGTTRRLAALRRVSQLTGATDNQVVLAWLLGRPAASSPIVGTSSVDQLREAMHARDVVLTEEQVTLLDEAA
jgi:aryl-alcohol dehydrogenase-like predicted oxidoreductase